VAFTVTTDALTGSPGSAFFHGSWNGAQGPSAQIIAARFKWGYADAGENETTSQQFIGEQYYPSGSWADAATVQKDRIIRWQACATDDAVPVGKCGSISTDKTKADAATAGTPTASNVLSNSATIACTFDPKVAESTFQVFMQYRKLGDSTWITAGSAETSGTSISRAVSGLLGSTVYQFKMVGSRTTANLTTWESTVQTFTTLADAPTITTDPATVVTSTTANLNGTVDPNGISGVEVRFGWGTADGGAVLGNWQNATAPQAKSGPDPVGFSQNITGLSPSTTYFHRAFVTWP
jgi:hypothetical protein